MKSRGSAGNGLRHLLQVPKELEAKLGRNWDRQTKQDKLDNFILSLFPSFVVACAAVVVAVFLLSGNLTFGHFLVTLSWVYVMGFALLGVMAVILSENDVVRMRYSILIEAAITLIIAIFLWELFGTQYGLNAFLVRFFTFISYEGFEVNFWDVLASVCIIALLVVFTAHGVLAVVVAYFRKNYHRILLALEKPGESRLKRIASRLFAVPDIIDVTEVTIDPRMDDTEFNVAEFRGISIAQIVAGMTISSYLFLNPVFLETIPFDEMMIFMMLVSMFLCVIIVPCSILRSLGAQAHSAAPRPFILWKGMKNRLFQSYFVLAVVMTLLGISAYTGMDMGRIFVSYVGYLVFLALMSITVSFVYLNTFYVSFKNGIIRYFLRAKYGK